MLNIERMQSAKSRLNNYSTVAFKKYTARDKRIKRLTSFRGI